MYGTARRERDLIPLMPKIRNDALSNVHEHLKIVS